MYMEIQKNAYVPIQIERNVAVAGLHDDLKERMALNAKVLLNIDGLSAYLQIPKATIYGWTHQKKIPHLKIGKALRFDLAEVDLWLKTKTIAASQLVQ